MNQLYSNEQNVKCKETSSIENGYFDINSLFWSNILAPDQVQSLIVQAQNELSNDTSAKVKVITDSPKLFYSAYMNALEGISSASNRKILYQYMETLEMVCNLHTKLISAPFTLTLSQGYVVNNVSAVDMERNCLLPYYNPYLNFIKSIVVPRIIEYQPQILVLTGAPSLASFAIAKLAKKYQADLFVICADYESDYYSLRKIEHLLLKNNAFFKVYNCVILDDYNRILAQLSDLLNCIDSTYLQNVPNIIFSLDKGKSIIRTERIEIASTYNLWVPNTVNKNYVHNMRAFPQNHCYWNQCSFCGINSKYNQHDNSNWDLDALIQEIKSVVNRGIKFIWFLDESIPVSVLRAFSIRILHEKLHFIWHVRTRVESQFVDSSLVDILYQAGLRHIIFGFESASERILSLMKKTPYVSDYLRVAECIVREFTPKIRVHFSSIIGFPSETCLERKETAMFLGYLFNEYPGFSYNVNTFYLDVGSKMFQRWEEYDIAGLSFPCAPQYFLGNQITWYDMVSSELSLVIQEERETLMKCQFDWYPEDSLIEPSVFYAFYEYSRLELIQEKDKLYEKKRTLYSSAISLSPMICLSKLDQETWQLYNLENHNYVVGGEILKALVDADKANTSLVVFMDQYESKQREQAQALIEQLHLLGFFA